MHRLHNEPRLQGAPETAGATIHWGAHYDVLSRMLGMGVNSGSSRMVIELADVKPGNAVLDVACGTGNLTLTAHSYAGSSGQVHGIDAAPEMIEVARQKAARSGIPVAFDVGLAEKLAFADETFDVVISRLAIHHLPDDLKRTAFGEILRVLKPGGTLLIADFVPPSSPILNHIVSAFVGSHMMQTNVWGLPSMLSEAGFEEVSSGRTPSTILAFVRGKKRTR